MYPHDYYDHHHHHDPHDPHDHPHLHNRGEGRPYLENDYHANDHGAQLPAISTMGRGPRGAGLTVGNVVDTDDTCSFALYNDLTGELVWQSPNLSPGILNFRAVGYEDLVPGEPTPLDIIYTKGGIDTVTTAYIPAGDRGAMVYLLQGFCDRTDTNVYQTTVGDLSIYGVLNSEDENNPIPRVNDIVFFSYYEPDTGMRGIAFGTIKSVGTSSETEITMDSPVVFTARTFIPCYSEIAEQERIANENARKAAELERIANENDRQTQEASRQANEANRISNEETRIANEQTREANEAERITNENARKAAETARAAAEADRVAAESQRVSNENQRIDNEADRVAAESQRVTNENARIAAEQARADAENTRIANENQRVAAEQARVSTENDRQAAEENRENAEENRQSDFEQMEDAFAQMSRLVLPIASSVTLGGIRIGNGLSIDSNTGIASVNIANKKPYPPGIVSIGDSLSITSSGNVDLQLVNSGDFENGSININDGSVLKTTRIYGKSSQSGTPTTQQPIAINSIGDSNTDIQLEVLNKNLIINPGNGYISSQRISCFYDDDDFLVIDGIASTNYALGLNLLPYSGSSLRLDVLNPDRISGMGFMYGSKSISISNNVTYTTNLSNASRITFVCLILPQNQYVHIKIKISLTVNVGSYPYEIRLTKPQLTTIPLNGNIVASLPSGLSDILMVYDSGRVELIKKIGKYTVLGTETIGNSVKNEDNGLCRIQLNNVLSGSAASTPMNSSSGNTGRTGFCTHGVFNYVNNSAQYITDPNVYTTNNEVILCDYAEASADVLAAYSNAEILYELATPLRIDLGYIDMPELSRNCSVNVKATPTPNAKASWWTVNARFIHESNVAWRNRIINEVTNLIANQP